MKSKRNTKTAAPVQKQNTESNMKTDIKFIQKLVKLLESSNLTEIEIEESDIRLRVAKNPAGTGMVQAPMMQYTAPAQQPQPAAVPSAEVKKEVKKEEPAALGKNLIEVKSPIVGTFYRAPSPTADPYVQVGTVVSKGSILCIIEAMKLMNEIESDFDGKIVKILVENAKPVEYNQTLFLIEPQ